MKDQEHFRIARKLENLHIYSAVVAIGFIIFWLFWAIALITAILLVIW